MRVAITAWSAQSAHSGGKSGFAGAVNRRRSAVADDRAVLADFDAREALGRKGTRSMDRLTGLAVHTVGGLLAEHAPERGASWSTDTALVLGTTTGSAESMMEFTRSALEGERPYHVDPARFPNTVMNCAAGQCAIWHGIRGPNTTLAGGHATGLHALTFARRLLDRGRARRVICGGVEEHSAARRDLERHASGAHAPLGEGCAVQVIEPAGAPGALAEVLAVTSAVATGPATAGVLRERLRVATAAAGVAPSEVWAVAPSTARGPAAADEAAVLAELFPRARRVALGLGDLSSASVAFQLAALLAVADADPDAAGRVAAVTAVEPGGVVACALLRCAGERPPAD
ncbi:beta-ketoacyl synthase N-terminal-like domain-containing protein [Actinokineospora guangxiensis]|uniref:Beta-ketoacyl synthase N-terminal-like domain-containing protein n=1 Tax=Actinokineospora guangxiensis TaxID=1490288 RepID=A0ABW0EH16_9PSEU